MQKVAVGGAQLMTQDGVRAGAAKATEKVLRSAGDALAGVGEGIGNVAKGVVNRASPGVKDFLTNPETSWLVPTVAGVAGIALLGALLAGKRKRDAEMRANALTQTGWTDKEED